MMSGGDMIRANEAVFKAIAVGYEIGLHAPIFDLTIVN